MGGDGEFYLYEKVCVCVWGGGGVEGCVAMQKGGTTRFKVVFMWYK